MNLAPIALFVYNRPEHTKKTITALIDNDKAADSILYIYSDAAKKENDEEKVRLVREYIHTIKGFKEITIIERKKNYGLAESIINGVSEVISKHKKAIVMEDDLISSPIFLTYMNNLLTNYENTFKIFSITGYNHPKSLLKIPKNYKNDIYFNSRACSWGWGTWHDRWEKADWEVKDYNAFIKDKKLLKIYTSSGSDKIEMLIKQMNGEIDSWAIRWDYSHFKYNSYCIYPILSYIDNIGNDSTGVHCKQTNRYKNYILNDLTNLKLPPKIELNSKILNNFRKIYSENYFKKALKKIIKKLLYKLSK